MSRKKKRPTKRKIADGKGTVVKSNETAFEPHSSLYGANIVYVDDLFTEDECEDIIEYHHTWEHKEGRISEQDPNTKKTDSVKSDYRICTLYCPPYNDDLKQLDWLNAKLLEVITGVNQDYYKFNILALAEAPNLMRYDAENSGHYDYHLDIGTAKPNCWRKLSYSLMLNDDYEGGKLEFKTGMGIVEYGPIVGRMILFPSYLLHKVNPVTSGIRWNLVGWSHGPSFQ
tara:strand:+ start:538 stop:1221 length:684 start_codon:yes stop_codon:yes gene_type:complete